MGLLGADDATKMDEFSEKFQTAFDLAPPTHFRKIMSQISFLSPVLRSKICNINF